MVPAFLLGLQLNAQTPITSPRGRECWVFRSVLDNHARILTAALHPDLWVAYDAANGNIFKIWKDGVKLQGPVYTNKHGVQPVSLGETYVSEQNPESVPDWVLTKNGEPVKFLPKFKGYTLKNNRLTLRTQLQYGDNQTVTIDENPEFTQLANKADNPGLIRTFSVSGAESGISVGVKVQANCLVNNTSALVTNGKFQVSNKIENIHSWGSTFGQKGILTLNPTGTTTLTTYFNAKAIK